MNTKAIVITAPEQFALCDVELTEPGAGDVIVQTAYTSISAGTERMLLAGRMPHPMLRFPVVPGYETVGRVIGRGVNVPPELEGQWVYVGGARCYVDVNPAWGGQAATLIVDHTRVVPLGAVAPEQGVLLALGATALHGVDLVAAPGLDLHEQRVLVLGQGPVGQIAARLARARGAHVTVTDKVASRLARAQADVIVDASDPASAPTGPFDVIIEVTGGMAALAAALPALASNGMLLLLGYYDELRLPYMPLFLKQARLLTAKEWGPNDLVRVRDMIATGALDIGGLITHRMPLAQIDDAYRVALGEPDCLKLVLDWSS